MARLTQIDQGKLSNRFRRTYESFRNARARCNKKNDSSFKYYGGRGVEFRIASLQELIAAIGQRPDDKTLDRINNDGHYEVGNIKWSTRAEQNRNKRYPNRIDYMRFVGGEC